MTGPGQTRTPPPTAGEALAMALTALELYAAADKTALTGAELAGCLRGLEGLESLQTAGRAGTLTAFRATGAFEADGSRTARAWLRWQTQITGGAATDAMDWSKRLEAHPLVGQALACLAVTASYARQICKMSDRLPEDRRQDADRILLAAAAGGTVLADLVALAEEMLARCAPPDPDQDDGFEDRGLWATRLFQGHGKLDGDLTPECLATLEEALATLGKKAGPEDDRTQAQRYHDALEEALRLAIGAGKLPDRAGQPTMVQLHATLDQLPPGGPAPGAADPGQAGDPHCPCQPPGRDNDSRPGAPDPSPGGSDPGCSADSSERGRHAPDGSSAGGPAPGHDDTPPGPPERLTSAPPDGRASAPAGSPPGGTAPNQAGGLADLPEWLTKPAPPGLYGQPGWLTGRAAEAYSCDAKIAPIVCGHLDRDALAAMIHAYLHGDDGHGDDGHGDDGEPECTCTARDRRARDRRARRARGGDARLADALVRYATAVLSGPAGLAAFLRSGLTGAARPASLPLDVGAATEEVPPHLRRAVISRDRHCAFPGCDRQPVHCHVHHIVPKARGGPTRLDNLLLLCSFHHLIAIHRWGWTITLHADGTTTAVSPDGSKVFHGHGPPGHDPPATADAGVADGQAPVRA